MHEAVPGGPAAAACADLAVEVAGVQDAARVVDVIACAFAADPTWSWAFPVPEMRRRWWQLSVDGALRYPWVLRTRDFEAVSIWIPPDGTELSAEDEARLHRAIRSVLSDAAALVAERMEKEGLPVEEYRDHLKVHRRGGQPCPNCGASITEITAGQRITNFCRHCQR